MADPKATELPEGWHWDGDETVPGCENKAGDSFELHSDGLYIGVRHAGYHTHFFTELPPPVLRALLSAHGLAIVSEADRKVLEALGNVRLDTVKRLVTSAKRLENRAVWIAELEARKTRVK